MSRSNLTALLAFALLAFPSAGSAQDVELQFIAFPSSSSPEPIELLLGNGKTIDLKLPTNNVSKPYKVPLQTDWVLGKTATAASPDEPPFTVFGQTKSISSTKQLILVLRKGNEDSDGFVLLPFNNATTGFGAGEYLILNASDFDIGAVIGDKKIGISPGKIEIIDPKPSARRGAHEVCYIRMAYRKEDTEWTPFFSSEWRYSEGARTLAFIYRDPVRKKIKLHVVRDYL